jgi:hypothetical protein
MITPYTSQQPIDDFGLRIADVKFSAAVAATTDTPLTIPGMAQRYKMVVKVEPDGEAWMAIGATAAAPAGGSFASTTSEMITGAEKTCREVKAGEVVHFYSTAGADIGVALYAIGTNN